MVNTGKPSKGCYMCRARRIKCDEAKPGCMRCQKSKRECPGYRDAFELNLRDETKSTKRKMSRMINHRSFVENIRPFDIHHEFIDDSPVVAPETAIPTNSDEGCSPPWSSTKSQSSKHSCKSSISSINSTSTSSSTTTRPPLHHHSISISSQLSTPIDQQAACFFLANFVLLPKQGTMRGYMDFLLPLLGKHNPDPCIAAAFSAVSIAAIGTRPNSKALLPKADLCYLIALKKINSALRDPKQASSDSALASVILLSFFEQITAPRLTFQGWSSHVDGAVALLKARGTDAFQTPNGRGMWHTVRAVMTIQHIANSKRIDHGIDWWMAVPPVGEGIAEFAILNLRTANMRSDTDKVTQLVERTVENYEKVQNLLCIAEELEQDYLEWFQSLPAAWEVKSSTWMGREGLDLTNSEVHPGQVHSYSEMWIAYHYNVARSSRILIWTTILRCVAWLGGTNDYRLTPEYAKASQVCCGLIEDIVASLPFFFSWNKDKDATMADRSCFACGTNDSASVKCLWGIFVMWPLFAAASSDFALPSQRIFLRSRLKHISEWMGIYQAGVLLKTPLIHPSMYIGREIRKLQAYNSTVKATPTTLVERHAKAYVAVAPIHVVTKESFSSTYIPAKDIPRFDPITRPQLPREQWRQYSSDFHGLADFARTTAV